MIYEIKENPQFNSREVYFDGKPNEEVREALKSLKMRWNQKKKCWYGYASDYEITSVILDANDMVPPEEQATVVTDGYMGGGAVYGSKSNRNLYGTDLSKAIRADIKSAGIKNTFVRCETYSGGQHLYITIKTTTEDVINRDEFIQQYEIKGGSPWIEVRNEEGRISTIHIDQYCNMTRDEQEEIRINAAKLSYYKEIESEYDINHYHLDKYHGFSEAGMKKLETILNIVESYRYDNSNPMVDYFDTNFYFSITTKPSFNK